MTNRIIKTEEFLRAKLKESPYFQKRPESGNYRLEHSFRVARIAGAIAKAEGMDEEAMIIAGLLHDVSYCLEFEGDDWKNHGRIAARIARPFLEALGFSETTLGDILYGIAIHVDDKADFDGERTAFALTIGDADNIDRFDAYRLYETLEDAGYRKMTMEQKRAHTNKMLGKLEEFLEMRFATATATQLWQQRIQFYLDFYRRLAAQLDMSGGYTQRRREECVECPEANHNLVGLSGRF